MTDDRDDRRTLLVDASVFITLADIGSLDLLRGTSGAVRMPESVVEEVSSEPAERELERALDVWIASSSLGRNRTSSEEWTDRLETAATHLGRSTDPDDWGGDIPLLAAAMSHEDAVVVMDDKPLRKTCKVLSVPVSGSIGVLIRAVERGALEGDEAKAKLEAMDEVGARLSARLLRRAERLIDDAAEN